MLLRRYLLVVLSISVLWTANSSETSAQASIAIFHSVKVLYNFYETVELKAQITSLSDKELKITAAVTIKKGVDENFKLPEKRLLLETDSPYLAPVPHRGKQNHPKYLKEVALKAASVRKMDFNEIAELITANAFSFFKIPMHRK